MIAMIKRNINQLTLMPLVMVQSLPVKIANHDLLWRIGYRERF